MNDIIWVGIFGNLKYFLLKLFMYICIYLWLFIYLILDLLGGIKLFLKIKLDFFFYKLKLIKDLNKI